MTNTRRQYKKQLGKGQEVEIISIMPAPVEEVRLSRDGTW
jgi:hypothetical protein